MAAFLERKHRQVIPRWRSFRTTAALGELDSAEASDPHPYPIDEDFEDKIRDWKQNKTIWHASELLGAALVYAHKEQAVEASNFILSHKSEAPPVAVLAAEKMVSLNEGDRQNELRVPEGFNLKDCHERIHSLRLLSHEQPLNSIVWMDLATLKPFTLQPLKF